MTWREVEGLMLVTLAVPFTVMVGEEAPDAGAALNAWLSSPDGMEGSRMDAANSNVHEVVDATVEDAWYVTDRIEAGS